MHFFTRRGTRKLRQTPLALVSDENHSIENIEPHIESYGLEFFCRADS